jgi:hypothetical protein
MSKDFPEMEYKPLADEQIELAPHEDAMEFWDKVMRSPNQPMARRMNAAKERAQYRYPKLGVVATTTMSSDTFSEMLERAIQRSQVKLIEYRPDESPPAQPAPIPPRPNIPRQGPTPDRRYRRS